MLKWFADRLAQTGRDARKDERGFTLIELLVVVIIIGILAAIAIPTFLSQTENANDADAQTTARSAATAAARDICKCCGSTPGHAATFSWLPSTSSPFLNSAPALTSATR